MSSGPWRKLGKRREERAGHPRHPSGTPSVSHLPCLGLSPVARSPPGDPVRSPLRELTLGHAELVVVLQPVAGRAAAVAPALLLQAVVGAAAVFRRAVGEAHLWADTEGASPLRPKAFTGLAANSRRSRLFVSESFANTHSTQAGSSSSAFSMPGEYTRFVATTHSTSPLKTVACTS